MFDISNISSGQLKAARSLVGGSLHTLATQLGVAPAALSRLEADRPDDGGPITRMATMRRLVNYFEKHGVKFVRGGIMYQTEKATA